MNFMAVGVRQCATFALIMAFAAVIVRSILGLLEEWLREQYQSDERSWISEIPDALYRKL
jgi:hypothetical protein